MESTDSPRFIRVGHLECTGTSAVICIRNTGSGSINIRSTDFTFNLLSDCIQLIFRSRPARHITVSGPFCIFQSGNRSNGIRSTPIGTTTSLNTNIDTSGIGTVFSFHCHRIELDIRLGGDGDGAAAAAAGQCHIVPGSKVQIAGRSDGF